VVLGKGEEKLNEDLKGGQRNKMVTHNTKKKSTAKMRAARARKMGLNASVHKTKKGYGVSVTRKK